MGRKPLSLIPLPDIPLAISSLPSFCLITSFVWLRHPLFFCGKKVFLTITTTASCKFGLEKNTWFGRKTVVAAKENDTFFRGFSVLHHLSVCNPLSASHKRRLEPSRKNHT
jgi:hypothetical protein